MRTNNESRGSEENSFTIYVILSIIAVVSFWIQAVVTEERFVPALNVIANYFNIPDDAAGATLMAAGSSSPELFSMIVCLFITHSSLGMGTIIGSEIFNQLIIVAGVIIKARRKPLQLEPMVVIREVTFYAMSLIFLYVAISDRRPVEFDSADIDHLYISLFDGLLLCGCYIVYVIVCVNFMKIESFLKIKDGVEMIERKNISNVEEATSNDYHAFDNETSPNVNNISPQHKSPVRVPSMPFIQTISLEPSGNFLSTQNSNLSLLQTHIYSGSFSDASTDSNQYFTNDKIVNGTEQNREKSNNNSNRFKQTQLCAVMVDSAVFSKPSKIHGLNDIERNMSTMNCFLWQRSSFYDKTRTNVNAWQLRWFTFTSDIISSIPDRASRQSNKLTYPPFQKIQIDKHHLLLKLETSGSRRNYFFLAPTEQIFTSVVEICQTMIEYPIQELEIKYIQQLDISKSTNVCLADATQNEEIISDAVINAHTLQAEISPPITEYPYGSSIVEKACHVFLLPIKVCIHYTIPDVRLVISKGNKLTSHHIMKASISIASAILWLIVGSYIMCVSLETLGAMMNIPSSIIGITVSAAGTSIPAYVASVVSAKQGLGNMAVSNVFGSNSFNILVGLGVPWSLYTTFCHGNYYDEMRDESITESVMVLASVLLLFVILVLMSGFRLYRWHAYLFIIVYITFISYAVGKVIVTDSD